MSSRFTFTHSVSHITRFVRRHSFVLAIAIAMGAGLVSLYSKPDAESNPQQGENSALDDTPVLAKFITHETPKTLPVLRVQLPDGTPTNLQAARGRLTLVNYWATWCAPCRKEMPQLDALAARYAARDVKVITLSVDRSGAGKGEKFLNDLGVAHVTRLYDASYKAARAVGLIGLPTTLLLNKDGREIGRLAGEADWDSAAVHKLLDYYLED